MAIASATAKGRAKNERGEAYATVNYLPPTEACPPDVLVNYRPRNKRKRVREHGAYDIAWDLIGGKHEMQVCVCRSRWNGRDLIQKKNKKHRIGSTSSLYLGTRDLYMSISSACPRPQTSQRSGKIPNIKRHMCLPGDTRAYILGHHPGFFAKTKSSLPLFYVHRQRGRLVQWGCREEQLSETVLLLRTKNRRC